MGLADFFFMGYLLLLTDVLDTPKRVVNGNRMNLQNGSSQTEAMMPKIEYAVRQVHRGFWTYDLIYCDEGYRTEFSVGECHSRRQAEQNAKAAIRLESSERFGDFGRE